MFELACLTLYVALAAPPGILFHPQRTAASPQNPQDTAARQSPGVQLTNVHDKAASTPPVASPPPAAASESPAATDCASEAVGPLNAMPPRILRWGWYPCACCQMHRLSSITYPGANLLPLDEQRLLAIEAVGEIEESDKRQQRARRLRRAAIDARVAAAGTEPGLSSHKGLL